MADRTERADPEVTLDAPAKVDPRLPVALSDLEVHVWSFSIGGSERGLRRQAARDRRAQILASYLGIDATSICLEELEGGKPVLSDGALEFNLSHSGDQALLAVSRSLPVGIDIEAWRNSIDLAKGIRDRCTQREGAHVMAACDPHAAWVRLWTRKEAVVKATGTGVLDQLQRIDVLDEVVIGVDGELDRRWRCVDLNAPDVGFFSALALPDVPGVRVIQRHV